jgi:hypothetical protein
MSRKIAIVIYCDQLFPTRIDTTKNQSIRINLFVNDDYVHLIYL